MKKSLIKLPFVAIAILGLVLTSSVMFWTGCSDQQESASPTATSQDQAFSKLTENSEAVREVMAVQNQNTARFMEDPNVVGTATGLTDDGRLAIMVYLEKSASTIKGAKQTFAIPRELNGVPVVTQVTGKFKALKSGGGGVSHTAKQTPPIQLGTSGGWRYDLANGYCCGGTLGSLVSKGGSQYILSNYHVLEADIVNGGNSRTANAGDPVIQPGLIDVSCNANNAQNVATLSGLKSLPGTNVDAAIAPVISGMVRTDGSILEIGVIKAGTGVAAFLNQAVKKSGRTSGLTRSTVSGLNATVSITYDNECAGGTAFTKTFTGQIVLKGGRFIQSGDSGSLMVQDVTTAPQAVGLCFAGSSTNGIANPIGQVLSWAGATMVGQ
ncbi:MAG: hypothetical protein EPO24_01365 [Bacteroidetes bacterium]|nr:MAG: hypothetical protein EPO24_01365 [Bacteroidota bacterium]